MEKICIKILKALAETPINDMIKGYGDEVYEKVSDYISREELEKCLDLKYIAKTLKKGKEKDDKPKSPKEWLKSKGVSVEELEIDMTKYEKAFVVSGNTKPVKDTIKACGGKWNGTIGGWIFPKKVLSE